MEKTKLFIGLSGKMGSGKSTIAHMLQAVIKNCDIMSMAAPLYKAQHLLYKEFDVNLSGDKDRELLIALGAWGRDKHKDFWLGQFAKAAMESDFDVVICDDVRFENEADFFKNHGILIRLEGEQRGDNVDTSKADNVTETALDDYKFDHVISNNKEPAMVCQEIAHIMMGDTDVA